jgi:pyruvate/2-oxoglutarate dehydrogenase complex dihydrolipoamide acyltransferase (E2) component
VAAAYFFFFFLSESMESSSSGLKLCLFSMPPATSSVMAVSSAGKIQPDDLQGDSFTITNLGGIGDSYFTPIINFPQVAILGIGRAASELVLQEGTVRSRLMLPLSLSYDHRVIDGADGARFLRWIIEALEQPLLLSLDS